MAVGEARGKCARLEHPDRHPGAFIKDREPVMDNKARFNQILRVSSATRGKCARLGHPNRHPDAFTSDREPALGN